MKNRAIKNLLQLKTDDFFREVSIGLDKTYKNCLSLQNSSLLLADNKNFIGANILVNIAKEEAAKFLILIDAIRCPKREKEKSSRQLEKFNEHLAKGIYADLCEWSLATYSELCGYIKSDLDAYYLDGPEGVEWIYRNSIISSREEDMYVDYVQIDDKSYWVAPDADGRHIHIEHKYSRQIAAIEMVKALHLSGVSSYGALKLFAEYWREFEFSGDTNRREFRKANFESLEMIKNKGLLKEMPDREISLVINELPFPLYKEAMRENKVTVKELKETRKNWSPEW